MMDTMFRAAQPDFASRALFWRAAVCVLLAVLSLYNPFLTVSGACDVLHVHHRPSFRATIASSELRRCTVEEDKILIPARVALQTTDPTPVGSPAAAILAARQDHDVVVVPLQQMILGGLWFRPPPSVRLFPAIS
jgi:hypothetical protein